MRSEIEYEREQELAAMGDHCNACMAAILAESGATTLADLQRAAYKYTDAGISVSFRLDDGTCIYAGGAQARDPQMVNRVAAVGFSSIVEGSDAEVPLTWLDLIEVEDPSLARAAYDRLCEETNDAACALWDEANGDEAEDSPCE